MNKSITHLKAPLFVWWDITYKCNLRCKQCYSNSGNLSVDELTFEEIKKIINQLKQMKVFYVYFLGGEPFLKENFIEITKYCHKAGLQVIVNTNGWFLDENLVKKIKEADIRHVRVSIDGATSTTHDLIRGTQGSFEKAVQAIQLLQEYKIPIVSITPTLMQENFLEVSPIIDLALKYNVSEIQFVQLCSTGRGTQANPLSIVQLNQLNLLLTQKKKEHAKQFHINATPGLLEENCWPCWNANPENHIAMLGCQAGRSSLNIGADGLVMPCLLDRRVVGNLRKQSLKQIWNTAPRLIQLRTINKACAGCQYQDICSQECPLSINATTDQLRKSYVERR